MLIRNDIKCGGGFIYEGKALVKFRMAIVVEPGDEWVTKIFFLSFEKIFLVFEFTSLICSSQI